MVHRTERLGSGVESGFPSPKAVGRACQRPPCVPSSAPQTAPQGLLLGSHSRVGTEALLRASAGPAQPHTQTHWMEGASSPPRTFQFSLVSPLLTQGDHTVTCPLEAERGRPPMGCGDGVQSRTGGQGTDIVQGGDGGVGGAS